MIQSAVINCQLFRFSLIYMEDSYPKPCFNFVSSPFCHSHTSPIDLHHYRTLREESSQTNVILQYKLLASILSAICSVIQQS